MPDENEETPEEKAQREAWQERSKNIRVKGRAKNKSQRDVLIKAKYGNGTDKTSLGTTKHSSKIMADDFDSGETIMSILVDPCPAGDCVVEWYSEVEDLVNKPMGRLQHNKVIKKQGEPIKNGGPDHYFHGLEEITIVEHMEPQLFEIDFEKVGGGKAKMQEGIVTFYRKEEYVEPPATPGPNNPVLPPYPIDQGV